jgi:hypothetical protein
MNFLWPKFASHRTPSLAENDTVFGYALAWEPTWQRRAGDLGCRLGSLDEERYESMQTRARLGCPVRGPPTSDLNHEPYHVDTEALAGDGRAYGVPDHMPTRNTAPPGGWCSVPIPTTS